LKDSEEKTALDQAFQVGHNEIWKMLADKMFPHRKSGVGFPDLEA